MDIDASSTIGGPAIITFDSAVIYTREDIEVRIVKDTREISSSQEGVYDHVLLGCRADINFIPTNFGNLAKLFPWLQSGIKMGQRIFGDTDKPIVIQSISDGQTYTYSRGAVTAQPSFGAGPGKDGLGQMTLTALKANATALSGANSVVATASGSFTDTSFAPATDFAGLAYELTYGAYADINTEDGIDLEFPVELADLVSANDGIYDMRLVSIGATATFIPVDLNHADFLAMQKHQGTGVAIGSRLGAQGADLTVEGAATGDPQIVLNNAFVAEGGYRHGAGVAGQGSVSLTATKTFTSGFGGPPATIGTVPAP